MWKKCLHTKLDLERPGNCTNCTARSRVTTHALLASFPVLPSIYSSTVRIHRSRRAAKTEKHSSWQWCQVATEWMQGIGVHSQLRRETHGLAHHPFGYTFKHYSTIPASRRSRILELTSVQKDQACLSHYPCCTMYSVTAVTVTWTVNSRPSSKPQDENISSKDDQIIVHVCHQLDAPLIWEGIYN